MNSSVCLTSDQIKRTVSTAVVVAPAPRASAFLIVQSVSYIYTRGSDYLTDPLVFTDGNFVVLTGVPTLVGGFFVDLSPFFQWHVSDGSQFNDPTSHNWEQGAPGNGKNAFTSDLVALPIVLACDFGAAITGNAANDAVLQIDLEYSLIACRNPYPPRVISQQYSQ